jgi:putative transcriptional regulator
MNLKNHLLISMPQIQDIYFSKCIIYIFDQNPSGVTGIIINKSISKNKSKLILNETGLNKIEPNPNIYFGGPVEPNRGIIIHSCDYSNNNSIKVAKNISITFQRDIIKDLINGKGPKDYRFTFGFSGWDSNQLEKEFENGDWLLIPSSDEFIFDMPDENKWLKISESIGLDIFNLFGSAGIS